MKSITQYIVEKIKIDKNSTGGIDILDVEIKSLEHLKDVLYEYVKDVEDKDRPIKVSRVLNKPIKWLKDRLSSNKEMIEVGDHFKIDFCHPTRKLVIWQINCAEYQGRYIFSVKMCRPHSTHLMDMGLIGEDKSNCPKTDLKPGVNLLEWLTELSNIKNSFNNELNFRNKDFLYLLHFVDVNGVNIL